MGGLSAAVAASSQPRSAAVLRAVLPVWALWASAVALLAVLAPHVVPLDEEVFAAGPPEGVVLAWWDFTWYADIARYGYPEAWTDTPAGWRYAFFPLFPALLALGGSVLPLTAVGALLVVAASLAAFVGVALLDPAGDPRRAAVALACLPGSFSLLMLYADGPALAAALLAALAAARGRPLVAGVAGLVVGLLRPDGFLLALPLGLLAWRRRDRAALGAAAAPLLGAGLVFLGFWARSGTPLAFLRAQEHWDRAGPVGLLRTVEAVAGGSHLKSVLDIAIAGLALVLAVVLWRRGVALRPWALYAFAVVGLSLASGSFGAIGRHAVTAFPLVWALAGLPVEVRRPLLVVGALVNGVLTLALVRYYP